MTEPYRTAAELTTHDTSSARRQRGRWGRRAQRATSPRRRRAGLARGGVVPSGEGVTPLAAREVAPGDGARAPDPGGRADVPAIAVPRRRGREQIGAVAREDRGRRAVRRDREAGGQRLLRVDVEQPHGAVRAA